jgi:hypothetical protein
MPRVPDVPAAHSMDTDWFAVDKDGHVAYFSSGEAGAVPVDSLTMEPAEADPLGALSPRPGNDVIYDLESRRPPGATPEASHWRFTARRDDPELGPVLMFVPTADVARAELAQGLAVEAKASAGVALKFRSLPRLVSDRLHAAGQCLGCFIDFSLLGDGEEDSAPSPGRLGIFVYDHLCENWIAGPYGRKERPSAPITVDELPASLRDQLSQVRLPLVSFAEAALIQPIEHVPCEAWGYAQLGSDLRTVRQVPGRGEEYGEHFTELQADLQGVSEGLELVAPATRAPGARPAKETARRKRRGWRLLILGLTALGVAVWLLLRTLR